MSTPSGPTLTAPFRVTKELSKGGRTFTYIPGPEVIERLNACLGYGGWSYEVLDAFHYPADDPRYVVAKGRLTALDATYVQFGGQSVNRTKADAIIDLADDYKGAASDAMKKCAQHIGVGLYLALDRAPTKAVLGDPPEHKTVEGGEGGNGEVASEPPSTPPEPSMTDMVEQVLAIVPTLTENQSTVYMSWLSMHKIDPDPDTWDGETTGNAWRFLTKLAGEVNT